MKYLMLFYLFFSCNDYQKTVKTNDSRIIHITHAADEDDKNLAKIYKMFDGYQKDFPKVQNLEPKDILALDNVVYVDVRESREQYVSMIKDAITKKQYLDNQSRYKEKVVVSYCTIGYRSGKFAEDLLNKGIDAVNMKGGVLLWSHQDQIFYKGSLETKEVHVYDEEWNLAKSGYISVY